MKRLGRRHVRVMACHAVVAALFPVLTAMAGTYYLGGTDPTGGATDGNGQPVWRTAAWTNLQSHMDAAAAIAGNDEIRIVGGTNISYTGGAAGDNVGTLVRSTNDSYRLTITGGWSTNFTARDAANTTLDAKSATPPQNNDRRRVFKLQSPTTLGYLNITGGDCWDNGAGGAGVLVASTASPTVLSHLNVQGNRSVGSSGGGIRNDAAGTVLEHSSVRTNSFETGYESPGAGVGSTAAINIFNVKFIGNGPAGGYGGGGLHVNYPTGSSSLIFGCLFSGNYLTDDNGNNRAGSAVYLNYGSVPLHLVNSTIAGNGVGHGALSGWVIIYYVKNSIIADNYNDLGFSWQNTFNLGSCLKDDIATTNPYVATLNVTGGYTGPAGFANAASNDYSLAAGSPAFALGGYLRDGSATFTNGVCNFKYVDVNNDGVYSARTDVVVKVVSGASPVFGDAFQTPCTGDYANHYIYTTDLAGRRRVSGVALDAGAYEYLPPQGTVITIR